MLKFPCFFRPRACLSDARLLSLLGLTALWAALPMADAATLTAPSGTLEVEDRRITLQRGRTEAFELNDLRFDYHSPVGWEIAHASEDRIEIALQYHAAVDFAHLSNDTTPRETTLVISRHGDGFRFHAAPEWSEQVTLSFRSLGDHFFGLSSPLQPDNRHSPDLIRAEVDVEVKNEGENIVENYASAFSSFFMSSHGYAGFFDTFGAGRYRFGINGQNQIHHETGTLDWYVFLGDDGTTLHRAYFDLIGDPKHVPLWALGPVAWRDQNDGGAPEILDDVARFQELQMPLTAWFVDRPYSNGAHAWSHMDFSDEFAEPEKWIRQIREDHGLEFMTWTSTAFFGDTPLHHHLPGGFTYADLSDETTVAQFQDKLTALQHNIGVKGHKMDRADEHLPRWENWADESVTKGERRNRYVYLFAKVHHDALERTWGDDQFTFARAAIHRSQPYLSAIWGGDPRQNWAGLQGNLANAIRASFIGFPVWGTDVGGYIGDGFIAEDLYLRWLQFGVMSGFLEIKLDGSGGDGPDRMPWRYDEAFQQHYRDLLQLRMDLLPYLYSLANYSAEVGTMMQPLAYRHLHDPRTFDIWDQFYLGDGLLVAPIVTTGTVRDVYLPPGRWYRFDFDEGVLSSHVGSHAIVTQAELHEIPLFVRTNSLLVTGDIFRGNARTWLGEGEPTLTIHAFPGEAGETTTFTYIDSADDNASKPITLRATGGSAVVTAPAINAAVTVIVHQAGGTRSADVAAGEEIDLIFND